MAAGQITIELLAKTGSFETDTARAGKSLKQFQKDADAAGRSAEASGRAIGLAFSAVAVAAVAAVAGLAKSSLSSVDAFNDLKDATGASVENISAIDRVARETGVSFGTVEAVLVNLNKALNAAEPDSKVARALTAIGLSAADLKKLDPAEAVFKVATALRGFADDGSKARAIQDIFNKSAKEAAPLLVDLAAKGSLVATVTSDQAQAVEDYRKQSFKLKADIEDLARSFTISLIPVLIDATAKIKELFNVGPKTAGTAGKEVADLQAQLKQLQDVKPGFSVFGFFGTEAQRKERIAQVEKELVGARASFQAAIAGTSNAGAGRGFVNQLPSVGDIPDRDKKTRGPKDDPTKKLLDNQLRAFQKDIDRERELFQTRNDFIELYNSQNLLSLKDYYSARQVALDEATAGEIAGIDKQIAALDAHKNAKSTTKVDAAADEGKLIDLREKRAKVEQDADRQSLLMSERQRFSAEELAKQFQSVSAQVLELGENFAAAAAVKFDLQFESLSKTFDKENNGQGKQFIATLRAAAIAQGAFQKASLDSGRTLDSLARAEDRIALSVQTGSLTSLEALVKTGEERRKMIPILERELALKEAIARGPGGTLVDLENVEAARLALDKLKASADPLAESLNKMFGDDFNDALTDFVTGTKNAADAFKAFSKSVLNDILKMGTKSITESLFGGSGGIGGAISQFFSKNSGASGVAGAVGGVSDATGTAARTAETAAVSASTAALSAFTASSSASTAALTAEAAALGAADVGLTALAASASAAAAALTAVAATSAASSGSSLLGFASVAGISGGRAEGGPVAGGKTYLVGERGPELLQMGSQSGYVIPNHAIRSSVDYGAFLHSGGIVGATKDVRPVPAGVFAGAPRYHDGGMARGRTVQGLQHDEVPAILRRREEVLREDDPRHRDNLTSEHRLGIAQAERVGRFFAPTDPANKPSQANFAGYFADGGTIQPGKWGFVGERGTEESFGHSTGVTVRPGAQAVQSAATSFQTIASIAPGERQTVGKQGPEIAFAAPQSISSLVLGLQAPLGRPKLLVLDQPPTLVPPQSKDEGKAPLPESVFPRLTIPAAFVPEGGHVDRGVPGISFYSSVSSAPRADSRPAVFFLPAASSSIAGGQTSTSVFSSREETLSAAGLSAPQALPTVIRSLSNAPIPPTTIHQTKDTRSVAAVFVGDKHAWGIAPQRPPRSMGEPPHSSAHTEVFGSTTTIFGGSPHSITLRPIFDDGFRSPASAAPTAASAVSRDAESLVASFIVLKDKEKEPFAGYFAEGGYVPPNTWAVAGERGPEKIYGGKTGVSVQPAGKGDTHNHISVTVQGQPGQSRDALLNQGATLGLGIQKAMARNT